MTPLTDLTKSALSKTCGTNDVENNTSLGHCEGGKGQLKPSCGGWPPCDCVSSMGGRAADGVAFTKVASGTCFGLCNLKKTSTLRVTPLMKIFD